MAFCTGLRTTLTYIELFTFHFWSMKFYYHNGRQRENKFRARGACSRNTQGFSQKHMRQEPKVYHGSLLFFLFFFLNGSIYEFEFEIHVAFVLNHQIFSSNKSFRNRTISNVCSMNQRWKTCFVFWIMHKLFQYFRNIFCQTLS